MEPSVRQSLRFSGWRDHFNTAALAVASYMPDALLTLQHAANDEMLGTYKVPMAIFLMLRFRWLREVPMFLSNLIFMPLIMRGRRPAPQHIQSITDEFCRKAGYKGSIKAYVYDRGVTKNAFSSGDRIYIGQGLIDRLTEKELEFVIGHEVAHSKTKDISERYVFWPPYIHAVNLAITSLSTDLATQAATMAFYLAYYVYQRGIRNAHSRQGERRADGNSVRMTNDPWSAASALIKIDTDGFYRKNPGFLKSVFWGKTHPPLPERLKNIGYDVSDIEVEGLGRFTKILLNQRQSTDDKNPAISPA